MDGGGHNLVACCSGYEECGKARRCPAPKRTQVDLRQDDSIATDPSPDAVPLAGANAAPLSVPPRNVLVGVALVVAATAIFAALDTATKHLAMLYDVPLIAALRYTVQVFLVLAVFLPGEGRRLFRVRRRGLVAARGASIGIATLCAALSLQRIPVAEMVSIFYMAPIVVIVLSGPLLGEAPGWRRILCGVAGFCGVLLIARPGGGLDGIGVLFAMGAAASSVFYHLLSGRLGASEGAPAMQLYTSVVGLLMFLALVPWSLGGPPPGALEMALLPAIGVLGFAGHYLLTLAYRYASAATIAPLGYAHLVWAGLLGWFAFGHVPALPAMFGMALIAAGGVAAALVSRRRE